MPIAHESMLRNLILSLSKAEKRHFQLYVKRLHKKDDIKFLQLFTLLDQPELPDEVAVRRQLGAATAMQYANLKRNLYHHLLTSLRLQHRTKEVDIQMREYIDYAHLLYERGLYPQALRLLDKAKGMARHHFQDLLYLQIVEFEKRIESRHITRSTTERMQELMQEARRRQEIAARITYWSNLKLDLQRWFINHGHATDAAAADRVQGRYAQAFRRAATQDYTFFERIHYYQARHWLYYTLGQWADSRQVLQQWRALFHEEAHMITEDVDLYLHGLHLLMTVAFLLQDAPTLRAALDELTDYLAAPTTQLKINSEIFAFVYTMFGRFNAHFLGTDHSTAAATLRAFDEQLPQFESWLDPHKVMLLRYKAAALCLQQQRPEQAQDYLNAILNQGQFLREDLAMYAHLLYLMVLYERQNLDLMESRLQAAQRLYRQLRQPNQLQQRIILLFRRLLATDGQSVRHTLQQALADFKSVRGDAALQRAFAYLNPMGWIEQRLGAGLAVRSR